jgi:hypothetical protein
MVDRHQRSTVFHKRRGDPKTAVAVARADLETGFGTGREDQSVHELTRLAWDRHRIADSGHESLHAGNDIGNSWDHPWTSPDDSNVGRVIDLPWNPAGNP